VSHLGEYMFVVTDLLTRKVINEVELQSFHWSEIYNKPGGGRATARIHHPKTTAQNFQSWNNGLWVIKDGDIRYGGVLGSVQPRAGTGVIDVPVLGFPEYLRGRIIDDISGMTNAALSVNDITWTNKDQFLIADDVIKHTQQGFGDIGLTTVWGALSGILKSETVHTYEHKFAGDWFEGFAARINGFGWYPEFYYSGDDPRCRIKLVYPRVGVVTELDLHYEENTPSNIVSYDMDGGRAPISGKLHLVGAGEGDDMVHTHITAPVSGQVRYDEVVSYKDVSLLTTLTEKGNYYAAQRETPGRQFTISIDWSHDMGPHYTEFRAGDEMPVHISDGYVQVDSLCTVISKQVTLSPTHDEVVKVTMLEMALL
jgi:hypothetical protein